MNNILKNISNLGESINKWFYGGSNRQRFILPIFLLIIVILGAAVYISVFNANQPSAEEISAQTTAVYQTEISKYLTAMPTMTPQPLPTNTPEVSPTPTEIVPMLDMFIAEDALLIYERPKFDSDVIGSLGVGESAVWAEERKDYSDDPNWHWYHVQFADVEQSENELFDGYVAVLTEQGRQMTQDTCPAVVADAYKSFRGVTGFITGAGQGYASITTTGFTLGKVTTIDYANAKIDSVNAVMLQLDPATGQPILVPFNFVIGFQLPNENIYHPNLNISGVEPPESGLASCAWCGLDHVDTWWNEYGWDTYKVTLNRDFVISRIEGKIVYGDFYGGGDLGTQFNYFDSSTYSYIYNTEYVETKFDIQPELNQITSTEYSLFSQYEMETGDRMNSLFLQGKQVPADWINMGFNFTRFQLIPDTTTELYSQTESLAQCLQAIGQ